MPGDRRRFAVAYLCSIFIHAIALLALVVFVLRALIEGGAPESVVADTQITIQTETAPPVVSPPPVVVVATPVPVVRPRVVAVPVPARPRPRARPAPPKPPIPREIARIVPKAPPQPPTPPPAAIVEPLPPTPAPTVRPTVAPSGTSAAKPRSPSWSPRAYA